MVTAKTHARSVLVLVLVVDAARFVDVAKAGRR